MLKKLSGVLTCMFVLSAISVFAGQGAQRMLYMSPNMTFICTPSGDNAVTVNDVSGSISILQSTINAARANNPTNVIVILLASNATYSVSSASLTLGSMECLVADSATIQAANSSVTVPLVEINSSATNVSIAGGAFDGNGASINAIYAPAAGRVNVDKVIARNCGLDCILLKGQGNFTYDNEMTVTRCDCSGSAAHAGISIQNSTQTAVIDNNCHNNSVGIFISCAWADVANNTCESNSIGIDIAGGDDNVVANNTCNNNGTGIASAALNDMILSCSVGNNLTAGISSSGSGNTFADNLFTPGNSTNFISGGSGNNVIAYKGSISAPGQNYFYPPLIDDQHTNAIVNGMGRTDLSIASTTIDSVQSQYNTAYSSNPNSVMVLHLNGTFTVGATPLTLQSNTCVLLNGTIQINSSTTAPQAITSGSSARCISVSGGIIDGSNLTGNNAIYFTGSALLQVDAMRLQNFGADNPRVGSSDILRITGGATPQIVTRCTITNGAARGIWFENSGVKRVASDCEVTAVNQDGVDCDASTSGSVVKFNNCHDLVRYGVFFEQSASHNVALGNVCNNDGRDINLYNNSTTPRGSTEYNSVLCNSLLDGNGLRNGSTGTNVVTTSHNFIFNNQALNASISSEIYGTQNYYSQNYQSGGSLSTAGVEVFFNSTDVSSNIFLQDSKSGLTLEVQGASKSNGAAVVIDQPSGLGYDQWALIPTDSGYFQLRNKNSGLDMNVSGALTNAGAVIIQWPFGSTQNDQWMPKSAGNGLYYVLNRHSGLCLDVSSLNGGTQLDQQPYSGVANQQFNLTLTPPVTTLNPFAIAASPPSQIITAGGSNTFNLMISTNSNFSGSVIFSLSGLPLNTTSNFNPVSLNGNGVSILTVTTTTNTSPGVYPLTVAAIGSGTTNTALISLIINNGIIASSGMLLWTGGGADNNWSTPQNWTNVTSGSYGPPGVSNDVIFTNFATVASSNLVNNVVNGDATINSLTFNNTNGFHAAQIVPGGVLTVIGSKGLTAGTEADSGAAAVVYDTITGPGGALAFDNTNANFIVREGTATSGGTQRATLDLSGLGHFNATVNQILVGVGGSVVRETGTLELAATNSITASGSPGILVGDNNSNGGGQNYFYLGQTNSILADSIAIGRQKATAMFAFNPMFSNCFAYFRASGGTNRASSWNIGDASLQSSSSSSTHGTVDFTAGTVDAFVDTLIVGKGQKTTGMNGFGTLTFGSGTIDVNTLQVGAQAQSGATSAGFGTVNVNGSAVLKVNNVLQLGITISGAGATNTGILNLNGGLIQVTNISGTGGIARVNLNSGTLNMQGGQMTNITSLNIGDGISSAAQLINAATIVSPNTINIAANGLLAGAAFVSSPALIVNGTISAGANSVGGITNSGTTTFGADGNFVVAVQNAIGAPTSGWTFLQTSGQLNVLAVDTNPFVIQLQSFDPYGSGEVTNFSADTNYNWTVASSDGGITNFIADKLSINTSQFQNDLEGGYFYIGTNSNSLVLSFTNNHPPVAGAYMLYQTPNGVAIPISNLTNSWSDPDGDPVILSDVNGMSTNGIPINFDNRFIYYTNGSDIPDEISYTVQDVRTNPPAVYRPGDTQRTATGEIIFVPPPPISGIVANGNSLIFSSSNGIPGSTFCLLETTNIALPISQWQSAATNSFDANGNFIFTIPVNAGSRQQFYLLQIQ